MLTTAREQERKARQDRRFVSKETQTAAKYLRRIRELSGAPDGFDTFIDTLGRVYVDMKGADVPQGQKTIGTYCVMVPQELVYAAGAVPVKLCSGNYTAFSVGDDIAPRDACPLVKAVAGFRQTGLMPVYEDCSMMVVPITCDCKKKIAGMLGDRCEVVTMHIPAERGDDEIDRFTEQLYDLTARLEDVTGNRVTYSSLAEGFRRVGRAQYELSEFIRLKKQLPCLIRGTHAMTIMNAAAYMTADKWSEALHRVNSDLRKRAESKKTVTGRKLPRILLTGSPIVFPNMKIPLLIEEMGGIVAGDETCMGERGMYDPPVITDESFDGMMRSLANRSLRPCPCPTFADNSQRIYRLKQLIADNQIQGVIYHVLRGCLVYDFEYRLIEEELGRLGIPVIRLESDYNEEDVEQLRIRIEAFIELIKLGQAPEKRTAPRTGF
ncbi:Benzoyl-CoA reductase/2-hydroxyglutaryl-CoA dehydratase subunit, BcrC/BadD/HgdB [Ruminococcus sp. YE71]|uniref:2-hydroxyacyl-CoA dehydratase subunit D n=1 Tax=unclassified Ruminococcus TaxID=2608920 RepID=UPI00088308E3|nr:MULTISPECIES: 2-hydroxyacyl-CoA dehydratase family protein [unclassified Ruminococcus]SDA19734.1 Benzoyl-CoA reductase/2-hydroxyglutaryl-CoA dehydratase subunit, BcrC/BadD/HgdB [Ruminococcus sp. YE78]SFW31258.1 Benzoyl-CoA reductase/2-hydroxyglutaryl-CoA dehydratase subunit, BcrC/BadD/HgdB [Ruminococcus sp. YE71]